MKLKICCAFVIYALILVTTACPVSAVSADAIQTQSSRVARYANAGVEVTRLLYENHTIPLATKDLLANGFISLAKGGIAFDATLASLKQQYSTNIPQSQLVALVNTFNSDIVDRFAAVLVSLKVISAKSQFAATIDLLRTAVLAAAAVLKIKSATTTKLAHAS